MRLVFFSVGLKMGGAEVHTVRLVNTLAAMGIDSVDILLLRRADPLEADIAPAVSVFHLPRGLRLPTVPLAVRAHCRRRSRQAIITVQEKATCIGAASLVGAARDVRHVAMIQGLLSKKGWEVGAWRHRALYRASLVAYRRAQLVVALSHDVRCDLVELGVPPENVAVVPNIGMPPEPVGAVLPSHKGLVSSHYMVACGRLVPAKAYERLLRIAARVKQSIAEFRLVILGDGPLRPGLEALVENLNLGGCVFFVGSVPDPRPYMAGALAMLHTARHEGFGNALVECLSVGTPVIAYDCPGGIKDIFASRLKMWLIEDDDEDEFVRRIMDVWTSGGVSRPQREACFAVARRYSSEAVARRFRSALLRQSLLDV